MTMSRSSRGRRRAGWRSSSLPEVDLVLAPVSGGGLLSGIAAAVKRVSPRTKVFGVEPELAGDATESFRTGKVVTWSAELTSRTIADGLRTQSVGVRNFAHIRAFVDGIITVTEAEIRAAMRAIVGSARIVPEPSGAASSAALLFHRRSCPSSRRRWRWSAEEMSIRCCCLRCLRKPAFSVVRL